MNRNRSAATASGSGITFSFAGVILLALVFLVFLRHAFGSIRVEAGAH